MFIVAFIALLVTMSLVLFRGVVGPSVFDRILAVNAFGTNIVLLIAVLCFVMDSYSFLDVALIYALVNFVTTIAFLRYFKHGSFRG